MKNIKRFLVILGIVVLGSSSRAQARWVVQELPPGFIGPPNAIWVPDDVPTESVKPMPNSDPAQGFNLYDFTADGGNLPILQYKTITNQDSPAKTVPLLPRTPGSSGPLQIAGLNTRNAPASLDSLRLEEDNLVPDVPVQSGQKFENHERISGDPVPTEGDFDYSDAQPQAPRRTLARLQWMGRQSEGVRVWRPQKPETLRHRNNRMWGVEVSASRQPLPVISTKKRSTAFFGIAANPEDVN
ncbi:MAG: hypothetical protein HY399_07705 [Elusimicrobia bacterium]|nr:hypothetical protein [Elusimicrobiota bacterium]